MKAEAAPRPEKIQPSTRVEVTYHARGFSRSSKLFWTIVHHHATLTEHERMARIQTGLEHHWLPAVKAEFHMTYPVLACLANVSSSTLERRLKSKSPLDSVASERFDRLAQVAVLAEDVFEDKDIASKWMATANDALGGETPLALCSTELGGRQVRRVLHAIEWGGVA